MDEHNPIEIDDLSNDKPRDLWFDPWRFPQGDALRSLAGTVRRGLEHFETVGKARRRRRKGDDAEKWNTTIEAVTCNLAIPVLDTDPRLSGQVACGRAKSKKTTRYDHPDISTELLNRVVDGMEARGLLVRTIGSKREQRVSTFAPTSLFANQVTERGLTLADIGRRPGGETIILRHRERVETGYAAPTWTRTPIDYVETDLTGTMRQDLGAINDWLADADLEFLDDGGEPVNTADRFLRRYFLTTTGAAAFDEGGRLYGGCWQPLKKSRRGNIRLEGEPIAVVDLSGAFPRLAYLSLGLVPPDGELYDIADHLDGFVLAEHRKIVKALLNACLNGATGERMPRSLAKANLPVGMTAPKLMEAIRAKHPDVADLFGTTIGLQLQRIESKIMVNVLKRMAAAGFVGLPCHDAVFVPVSRALEVQAIMEAASEAITGVRLPVDVTCPEIPVGLPHGYVDPLDL